MGMFLAFIYWELKVNAGIQTFVALVLTVLVAAPIMGAVIERIFMRRLTTAPLVSQLVVTIGLMLFLIGLAATLWDPNETRSIGTFFGSDGFNIGQTFVPWYRMITVVAGLLLALGIRLLLYRTRLGVAMRAVVDNRELAALNGARPGLTSQFSWALGTSMAALAGIFLAEELSTLSIETLTLLIIDAFAAAIIGRLKSLPMTYVGGMIIGLSLSFQANFLTWSGRWSPAGQAIPTIILFLALLFLPQARIEGRRIGKVITPRLPTIKRALFGFGVLLVVVWLLVGVISRPDVRTVGLAIVTAFIMLSLVPLIGWSGQISLAQITFVGVGAWAAVEFADGGGQVFGLELFSAGNPLLLVVGALVAVPIGVLMALPALRLQGLYLALASLAFARLAEFVIFDQPEVFGGAGRRLGDLEVFGTNVTEPFDFLGLDFPQDAGFVLVITVMFCIFGFGIVMLRRSAFGRRLEAMKDSPAACATLGVNLLTTKVAVFALSAAMAGFGGAMLGMLRGSAATANYQVLQGLPYVILIVVGGASVVSGALLGGFFFQMPIVLVDKLGKARVTLPILGTFDALVVWQRLATGLLGVALGRQPEGIVPEVSSELDEKRRKRAQDAARAGPGPGPGPADETTADTTRPTPVPTPGS
jgi:branched-chain amino acid transport system permease protein